MATSPIPRWITENAPEVAVPDIFRVRLRFPKGPEQQPTVVEVDVLKDLDIDFDRLEEHLETIQGQFAFYACLYSEAKAQVRILEKRIAMRRAVITKAVLEAYKARSIKITDKQLMSLVDEDEKLKRLELELIILEKNVGKLGLMIDAVRMRSEHCRSLAGFKRQEREQSARQS